MNASALSIAPESTKAHLPGEVGIWVFVFGDMMIFTLFFCTFVFYRAQEVELFRASQLVLNQNYGVINTMLLLTSSAFVFHAVRSIREGLARRGSVLLALAFLCGGGFAVIKIMEYSEKIGHDITPVTNNFYMFYFMLTGIHFMHVLLGLGVLVFLWLRSRRASITPGDIVLFESGATFWHMVDLLWIVLFPLLYLMK